MGKDPAVLFYIDKWLTATASMKGNAKGWYLNLILFQYDMGSLPDNIEELATLCGVRISEYEEFKQVFEQVLKQKFEQNSDGRLENEFAKEIIQKRRRFVDKRSNSGKIGYLVKYLSTNYKLSKAKINFLKENIDLDEIDLKDEQVLKQVVEQNLKLYINVNVNKDIFIDTYGVFEKITFFKDADFQEVWVDYIKVRKKKKAATSERAMKSLAEKLIEFSRGDKVIAMEVVRKSADSGWSDIYPLKGNTKHKSAHKVSSDKYSEAGE